MDLGSGRLKGGIGSYRMLVKCRKTRGHRMEGIGRSCRRVVAVGMGPTMRTGSKKFGFGSRYEAAGSEAVGFDEIDWLVAADGY
jgi:hypothetical protein